MSEFNAESPEATPLRLRDVTFRNRIWMSPMAQYAAGPDGLPTEWHLAHYGPRAIGGVGLVMVEATAISPDNRCTVADLGLWNEEQALAHRTLTSFVSSHGAVPAVQLNAVGRKGSHQVPWVGAGQNEPLPVADGGWDLIAPSAIPFGDLAMPRPATAADLDRVVEEFAHATRMAQLAGYQAVEIHASHGYLLHQFLSPLSNHRTDEYGGSAQNRMRFPLRVARAVREAFPDDKPVFVRITATDWVEGSVAPDNAAEFAKELAAIGIDLLDVTSGVLVRDRGARPPNREGVNVEFAAALKDASGLAVAPVGQITDLTAAGRIIRAGKADAVLIGRSLLRDPYLALRTQPKDAWPVRYQRAF
ncbi:NADH:flavin oxidoreductase/NADH oxidase [Amycolatopsis orientalis]|uniref:NADH:flavin oxidoreductase/NADH oxidase n=1 Tax=Amycolatopsis orientalis TaxID=31958 RepID=UPI00055B551D|nr:NADH:flavin oxidoreductase/NADH oxidase [Amycolatopsis orientalis]